ncbi:MAG: HAD-IIIA family hydrolase [Planctomycetes bacterium]|nr:HAD-IIIA family hydrolase [Planctomycetota bacterium]
MSQTRSSKRPPSRADWAAIRCLVFDVDGVLTDGRICLDERGVDIKAFSAHDGAGFKFLHQAGLASGLITGRRSGAVTRRARELGIATVIQNSFEKSAGLDRLLARTGFREDQLCFVGDDLTDLVVFRRVALPIAVANARPEVKQCARYVTRAQGGQGAAREVIEQVLKAQGLWAAVLEHYAGRDDASEARR